MSRKKKSPTEDKRHNKLLEPNCPKSEFWVGGPHEGHHCGCVRCCFCQRPNPLALTQALA